MFSDEGEAVVPEDGFSMNSDTRLYLPMLNIEQPLDVDSKFKIELELKKGLKYSSIVDFEMLQKMKSNKTIGF